LLLLISFDKQVIIITGSNTGIGKETARVIAKQGGHVIIAARDQKKSEEAKKEIILQHKDAKIDIISLDLGDSTSIDKFVTEFEKLNLPLNLLINNAGVMMTPERKTKDGFEYQNGINHLGHFRLTLKLLPIMIKTEGQKRIVNLSSSAHTFQKTKIDFDNYHFTKEGSYSPVSSYAQSKLSNILFTKELQKKLQKDYKDQFLVVAVHPGVIQTELGRDLPGYQQLLLTLAYPFTKSIPQGAATTIFASVTKDLKGGEYCCDCAPYPPTEFALDEVEQDKLWKFSEKETKVTFEVKN